MYLLQRASPGEIESQIIRLIRLIPNKYDGCTLHVDVFFLLTGALE
jgi:hypothetical protein